MGARRRLHPLADHPATGAVPRRAASARAQDVLASYARITDPKKTFRAKSSLALIDLPNSRAVDDQTVEFRLERPFAEFPNALAAFGAYIVPEGSTDFGKPVGSGPFSFVSWKPGSSVLLKRNPSYWEGAPYIEELEFLIASEESARVNALLGGQVEYAHDLTPTSARQHEGRVTITRAPNSAMHAFAMKAGVTLLSTAIARFLILLLEGSRDGRVHFPTPRL
ncbi:ABC transporter substrate-binding protein [Nonomuraea jabiensis]|uniref:ABC-type transport system substrate-binding protein n=1 Tax=Nonomuraea jabiensis TaxID=882448 RepID=A0A7W9LFB6_9ACTN|nr:ABC transporter substrate-binding protein [Nonomuraea jabiensis]MBB5781588.1 ABC-type transport system substrate-binding protein [Nonomuraea jabiensis]